jgi:hypothetical protein
MIAMTTTHHDPDRSGCTAPTALSLLLLLL